MCNQISYVLKNEHIVSVYAQFYQQIRFTFIHTKLQPHFFVCNHKSTLLYQENFQKLTLATQKPKTRNLRIARFNHNFITSIERKYQYVKNYAAKFRIAQHLFQSIYT